MKMFNEEQLMDIDFRTKIIEEIESPENYQRKAEMKRRYEVFKDNTKKYVLERMEKESSDANVVDEIIHRTSNKSFCRRIIDKKAMVYRDGVTRTVPNEEHQRQIELQVDLTNMNSKMVKINKYVELFKNTSIQVVPFKHPIERDKYGYKLRTLQPYLYDVIEDEENPEEARVYITSYYNPEYRSPHHAAEGMSGNREADVILPQAVFRSGDERDQKIADAPDDKGVEDKEYIWWSNKYHFTTDGKGNIKAGKQEDDLLNPIGRLPFYNFADDQDGQFWALGGEDIVDECILANVNLTDTYYIAKYQGQGIGYMWGKGVPKNLKVGASSFITMDVEADDPRPEIGFATSNPPLPAHLEMVNQGLDAVLETNGLRAKVSANGASASGIHEILIQSENLIDIETQREMYRDAEPVIFYIMAQLHNLLFDKQALASEFAEIGKITAEDRVKVKFPDPQPFVSEKEKLDIIEKRLSIGLDSMADAIIKDNPDLTKEEAEEKLKRVIDAKMKDRTNRLTTLAPQFLKGEKESEEE